MTQRREKEQAIKTAAKPRLDPAKLYQDGFAIADIGNATIDISKNEIRFNIITASNEVDSPKA